MNLDTLFATSPFLGGFAVLCLWFYTELQKQRKEHEAKQAEFHKELMEMQSKVLVASHEMTTAMTNTTITVANNTTVMNHILQVVERLEIKKKPHHPV